MRTKLCLAASLVAAAVYLVVPARAADELGGEGFLSAPLQGSGAAEPRNLSPDDIAIVSRLEQYLNKFSTVQARFTQISSQGDQAEGEVFLQRPGKMRFEYDDPSPVLLISDGNSLLYYDKDLNSATFVPLSETPLWFIMRPTVSLTDRTYITDLRQENGALSVTLRGEDTGDAGDVTLVFSEEPLTLRKWIVTDAQGIATQVLLLNPEFDIALEDSLFQYGDLDVYGAQGGPAR